jgi:hypothetical protein
LNGAVTDDGLPTGNPMAIHWIKVSGPGVVIFGDNTAASTTAQFSLAGTYLLRLNASDFQRYGSDDVIVIVASPVNQPPIVSAGPDQTNTMGRVASLLGTVTDDGLPAGSSISVAWSKVSGPGTVSFSNPNTATAGATFGLVGFYTLRLAANDGQLSASDDIVINVKANLAPAVNAGPDQTVTLPSVANLNGTMTNDGLPVGSTTTLLWTK